VEHEGEVFRLHVHVVPAESPECDELRTFRDRLTHDAGLRAAYEAEKRRILDAGVRDGAEFAEAKTEIIRRALDRKPADG